MCSNFRVMFLNVKLLRHWPSYHLKYIILWNYSECGEIYVQWTQLEKKKIYIYIWLFKLFPCRLDTISQSSRAVTSALAFISSCANPVLYTFAGKSYIKKNGFAFMAKLFEGTLSDQTGTKSTRLTTDNVGESNVDCQNRTVASTPENRNVEWTSYTNRLYI